MSLDSGKNSIRIPGPRGGSLRFARRNYNWSKKTNMEGGEKIHMEGMRRFIKSAKKHPSLQEINYNK